MEVAVTNAGLRAGTKAMTWAYEWAVVREALGHDPSVEEVAKWWAMPERSAYREQAAFRQAFPTLDNPGPIYNDDKVRAALKAQADFGDKLDELGEQRRARKRDIGIAQLSTLPATNL
jgi:hypothetical protein